ncbi:glutaminase GtaA [Rhizoctonia solani]|uniref:Glutaminase GtaA n=1 Tax=Rhizoctonia solani TaxID=456999 RepID=A0A8H8SUS1_9AGAM|nr:glutaminase GtaA [Rhizoctonia solani]QRW18759.1 glutaminase GtaA [Rhizoctonia solani]
MRVFSTLAITAISLFGVSSAQNTPDWQSTPFNPPAIPLATLGWAGYIRVDGKVYTFLGAPNVAGATLATQKKMQFTATKSTFVLAAGPVDLTVQFLSPVEPTDYLRQSLPFSYMTLSAKSTDGASHSVQYYTDISAEWTSGDNGLPVKWSTSKLTGNGNPIIHQVSLQNPVRYAEINDHTQYGTAYYATNQVGNLTYATGEDRTLRTAFVTKGVLDNSQDTQFRAINDRWPVFAFARDIGSITDSTKNPVVFAVGHVRDPLVQYIIAGNQQQERHPYWLSKYANANDALSAFLSDSEYQHSLTAASALDTKIFNDATPIHADYTSIVQLSTRQAFAAVEITLSKTSSGSYNTSDVKIFMKEISSNGNMNTVDVIFPAWPAYLYLNPDFGRRLLEPLFQYQQTGQYPNKWSIHDLGAHYPNATGHNDGGDEPMPVEECLSQNLVYRLSTDDFAGHLVNQTNLAIKGIIGIQAMGEIANVLGKSDDAKKYKDIAASYVPQWQKFAHSNEGHLTLNYGNASSWFNLFPKSVYDMQTGWYGEMGAQYGVALDSRHPYTKSDWEIYTAGTVTDKGTRDMFIARLRDYLANGKNNAPFSDWYDAIWGTVVGFRARPVAGGHFALLVLPK